MSRGTFLWFVAPTLLLMSALLAYPLASTAWLSMRNCAPSLELVTVTESGPFGSRSVTTQRARLDAAQRPVMDCRFVGLDHFRSLLGIGRSGVSTPTGGFNEFRDAMAFTLLYVAATTPFVLLFGLLLALSVDRISRRFRGVFISASLLPLIITPVVGALCIKWLFLDGGLVTQLLAGLGVEVHWMAQAWSARLLVILYGIWQVTPFAFIVLYAGLQSVPQDTLEAAKLDGASAWQRLRHVTLPHLAPLIGFVTLIHVMDAYRVFEPVLVLTRGAFSTSVQYLTYSILIEERNPYKASAAAVLTLAGIGLLLLPLLRSTWREQRRAA